MAESGEIEALRRDRAERKGRIHLLEKLIEDKTDDLKRQIGRKEAAIERKVQLESEILSENNALSALDADLYRREQRLNDLKAELTAALMQVQCKCLENCEIEAEHQQALQACKAQQEKQRNRVTTAIKNYQTDLQTANTQIGKLNEKLRNVRGEKRVARLQHMTEYGRVVAGVVGVACGVLLQVLGALRLTIA